MGFEENKVSSFYPEKYGEYFASMSPLSSKVYWDVQLAESSAKQNLTYPEKCSLIDKRIIYDPIHFPKAPSYQISTTLLLNEDGVSSRDNPQDPHVFYDDPILDQDHITGLLLNVCPKKPDKYVYDENGVWLDEHSGSYSTCTEAQSHSCGLADMVDKIRLSDHRTHSTTSNHHKKYRAPTKPSDMKPIEEVNAEVTGKRYDYNNCSFEQDEDRKCDRKEIRKPEGIIGVSVMGVGASPKPTAIKHKPVDVEDKQAQREPDNLPQQVQNQDLIAELQAKLKKNRGPTQQPSPKPGSSAGAKILHKPKAPPPPPPQSTESTVAKKENDPKGTTDGKNDEKITGQLTENQSKSKMKSPTPTPRKTAEDEFVVDVSSPCKIATPKTGFDFLDNW